MVEDIANIISAVAEGLIEGFEADRKKSLRLAAETHEAESKMLRSEKRRIEELFGPGHPIVLTLEDASAEADLLESLNRAVLKRTEKRPRVKSDEWMIAGEVMDPRGKPAIDVIINIFDAERKFIKALGTAKTDGDGEFFRVYNAIGQPTLFEIQPEVFVNVVNKQNRLLFQSTESTKVEAGAVVFFDIQLGKTDAGIRPSIGSRKSRSKKG